tara:strand:- start:22 stop:603 length:582 start_codon:yes stop_codon:yes gene_type:complete
MGQIGPAIMPKAVIENFRILLIGLVILALDQITKWMVIHKIPGPTFDDSIVVVEGFFKLVHYGNTGAAWSIFSGNNFWLAIFSVVALVFLWVFRKHFGVEDPLGQLALGLILGGVSGNLIDRVVHHHVVDFLQFYIPFPFPAFNVADSSICGGVGLMFLLSFKKPKPGQTWAKKGKIPSESKAEISSEEKTEA